MPIYTLVVTGAEGHQHTTLSDFPDDVTAIADCRHVVTAEHPAIAVGRGVGDDVEFLGVWDWREAGGPGWTPDE